MPEPLKTFPQKECKTLESLLGWVCGRLLRGRSFNLRADQGKAGSDPPVCLPKSLSLHLWSQLQTGVNWWAGILCRDLFVKRNSSHLLNTYLSQELCPLHTKPHLLYSETQWERPSLFNQGGNWSSEMTKQQVWGCGDNTEVGPHSHTQGPPQPLWTTQEATNHFKTSRKTAKPLQACHLQRSQPWRRHPVLQIGNLVYKPVSPLHFILKWLLLVRMQVQLYSIKKIFTDRRGCAPLCGLEEALLSGGCIGS